MSHNIDIQELLEELRTRLTEEQPGSKSWFHLVHKVIHTLLTLEIELKKR